MRFEPRSFCTKPLAPWLSPTHSSSFYSRASPLEAFLDCPTVKSSCSSVFPSSTELTPLRAPMALSCKWLIACCLPLECAHTKGTVLASSSQSSSPDSTRSLCSPGTCACPRSPAGRLPTSKAIPCVLGQTSKKGKLAGQKSLPRALAAEGQGGWTPCTQGSHNDWCSRKKTCFIHGQTCDSRD